MSNLTAARPRNQIVGTWRLVSATLDHDGRSDLPFGQRPSGLLSFTADMHFVEVLTDSTIPRFAADAPGQGTDQENRAAMAKTIGIFGTYTVDEHGNLNGDKVEGCTFPNWIGDVRTPKEISATVEGNRMTEQFHRPDGSTINIVWQRVN